MCALCVCVCVQRVTPRAARARAQAPPSACRVHEEVSSYCREPVSIRVHPDTTWWGGTAWVRALCRLLYWLLGLSASSLITWHVTITICYFARQYSLYAFYSLLHVLVFWCVCVEQCDSDGDDECGCVHAYERERERESALWSVCVYDVVAGIKEWYAFISMTLH